MTPERWRRISRLYHDALAQPAGEREEFLREASAGDLELEREVRSLLAQPSGDDFLEDAASALEGSTLTGRLGRFDLRGLLGAGGMGEVYRAHDAALGRDVAVKVLPRAFTSDPDRLARFEREARLLAALNHPHVAAIYGVEEIPPDPDTGYGGGRALVLELVEGETLAERLRRGRLPVDDALGLAGQVASALETAHEKGIVHRDLKPANIKLRADGAAKVLDFGLAKAVGLITASPGGEAARSGETSQGMILGTPGYMSPEQARGQTVDKRADIWAFGCVLYEMLTGRPAFDGKTATDTLAAVVNAEPDLSALPSDVPQGVRRVIERCLVKDSRRRMRDIGDAAADLEDALTAPESVAERRAALPWIVAGVALIAASWLGLERLSDSSSAVDWSLERITYDSGLTTMPALSPDGQLIAYGSDRAGRGDLDIWVRQVAGGVPLRLTSDPADDHMPEFSPDGKQIVFRSERAGGGVYIVSALGGPERLIVAEGRRPRFSPDGSRLTYWTGEFRGVVSNLDSALFVVDLGGGTATRLAAEFVAARDAVWSPDGRSLLFLGRRDRASPVPETFDWWWAPLDGRAPTKTDVFASGLLVETIAFQGEGSPASWTRDGVLFTARGAVWTIPVSMEDGRPKGGPRRLTSVTGRAEAPSAAPDGSVVFAVTHSQRVIERAPLASDAEDQAPTRLYVDNRSVALRASETGDGQTLVFDQGYEEYREIWLRDTRTGRQEMLLRVNTDFPVSPTVSFDGSRVAYTVATLQGIEDDDAGYVAEIAGGVPKEICERCRLYGFLSDNRRVLASWDQERVLGVIDVRDGSSADLIRDREGRVDRPHASLDDRWLAFRHRVGAVGAVYVTRLTPNRPPPRAEWKRIEEPTTTGRPCGWSLDSKIVYTLLDTDGFRCVWGQRVDSESGGLDGPVFPVRHLHLQMDNGPSTSFGNPITADGLLYERVVRTGDLWRLVPTPRARD